MTGAFGSTSTRRSGGGSSSSGLLFGSEQRTLRLGGQWSAMCLVL